MYIYVYIYIYIYIYIYLYILLTSVYICQTVLKIICQQDSVNLQKYLNDFSN